MIQANLAAFSKRLTALFFIGLIVIWPSAAAETPAGRNLPIKVVTSISPLADLVANVGGDRVRVSHFVPLNVDPHTYEPSFSSLASISQAQVIFVNGDGLDRAARQNLLAIKNHKCTVVDLSQSIDASRKNGLDPHYWLDLELVQHYVAAISNILSTLDPADSQYFVRNASDYGAKLKALDDHFRSICNSLPGTCRNIVLYHNSWTYLCTRYGFNIVGIIETGGAREPSARGLAQLIRTARNKHVRAILAEPGHGTKMLDTVRIEAGIPVVLPMVEDSLARAPYNTYLGMMQANLTKLAQEICPRQQTSGPASAEKSDPAH